MGIGNTDEGRKVVEGFFWDATSQMNLKTALELEKVGNILGRD